jgi:hypothetical protein
VFLKDLAVAQLRVLAPGFTIVEVVRMQPWHLLRNSTAGERVAVGRYLGVDVLRPALYLSTHAWRGFREPRREEPWQARMHRLVAVLQANPRLRGILDVGWTADPRMAEITPHLGERADGIVALGGRRFRKGATLAAKDFAFAVSGRRRQLYDDGKYIPMEYGLVATRRDLIRWAHAHPESATPLARAG